MREIHPKCAEVMDDLGLIIDGDQDALARHADHLATCDVCRDARYDAERAAEMVRQSGADYRPPGDLEPRVLGTLEKRNATVPRTAAVPDEERPTVPESGVPPTTAGQAPAPTSIIQHAPSPHAARFARWVLAAAAVFLVGIGGTALWFFNRGDDGGGGRAPGRGLTVALGSGGAAPSNGATTATVSQIVRAAADGATGVTVRFPASDQFAPATVDTPIPAGATVRTDDRTRARIAFSDGTEVVLNHGSELTLDASTPRLFRLATGSEVLAEVAHVESGPAAVFETPTGRVEVLGTKLLVAATNELSTVRVTRGEVRILGNDGSTADVKAGEEGLLPSGGGASVAQAVNLSGSVAWSEMGAAEQGVERSMSGLGELRASAPGEREGSERPLALTKHFARVRIVGNVARTEVEETFRNDSGTTLEGIYRFPLPPDARIARLALDVNGEMEDGAFIERDRASKIWRGVIRRATPQAERRPQEEFIWVPGPWRDPALLEWQNGGRFELRIFPIPANGERRVIIAYEQTVAPHAGGRRYVYPLPHSADASTKVGWFNLDLRVAGHDPAVPVKMHNYEAQAVPEADATRLQMVQTNFLPAGDVVVDYALEGGNREMRYWTYDGPAVAAPSVDAAQPGSNRGSAAEVVDAQRALAADTRPYVVFAIRPELPVRTENRPRDYVIVVDSSQSMVGERYTRAVRLVTGIIAEMDRRDRFTLMACDASCQSKPGGPRPPSSEAAAEAQAWLQTIRPAGATDLVATVRAAAGAAGQTVDRDVRVLYIGDGMATVGHRRASAVSAMVSSLARGSQLTFSTVGIGGDADTLVLSAIARAGGGHYVPYVPGQHPSGTALAVLESTYGVALRDARLELPPGVTDVAPTELPTLRAGEEVIVAARFAGEVRGEVVLRGTVGGQPYEDRYPVLVQPSSAAGNAFVPRLWAAASIDRLQLRGRPEDRDHIVALSRGYGVMSRHTSLLVLESEAMFRAFGVDRATPVVQWSGEEDLVTSDSEGTVAHEGPTVLASMPAKSAGGGGMARAARVSADRDDQFQGAFGGADAEMGAVAQAPAAPMPAATAAREPAEERSRRGPPAFRPGGRWMRRVWERVGSIDAGAVEPPADRQAVFQAEEALRMQPDSRDRHRDLVRALARVGDLERAEEVAEQWLGRDQLDPEALIALADIVGRLGRRGEALRLLTGIVDLQPDTAALHVRLADAFDRAGQTDRACGHRVALAELDGAEAQAIAGAVRCEQGLGQHVLASQILDAVTDSAARRRVEQALTTPPSARPVNGDLMIEATWSGPQDLDIGLIDSSGQRISWMGGRTNVVGDSAWMPGREQLGLRWTPAGAYALEVARTDPLDTTPISGQVRVRLLGQVRTIPFTVVGPQAQVAQVRVRRVSRLVPTW